MSDFLTYWARHADDLVEATLEHLTLTAVVLACSVALAALIAGALLHLEYANEDPARHTRARRVNGRVVALLSALYSIPSLALFALLIPITGLGVTSAIIVMCLYNQFLLVRSVLEGVHSIDGRVIEAARGMGMTPRQVLTRVQLPLAVPSIMAGIRLAAISTIGIATVAASINAGGLGLLLFSGLRTLNFDRILGAILMATLIAVLVDTLLRALTCCLGTGSFRTRRH